MDTTASLGLGLQFAEIGTLPGTLQRYRASDSVITGIEVFDPDGNILYSTDSERVSQRVPAEWLTAAKKVGPEDTWFVKGTGELATGLSVDNAFGLRVGYIALRYSSELVQRSTYEAAHQIALSSLSVFLVSATLGSLALLGVMGKVARDIAAVEWAVRAADPLHASAAIRSGLFGPALQRFLATIRIAETEIGRLRALVRDPSRG
jgi:hypothetical protein